MANVKFIDDIKEVKILKRISFEEVKTDLLKTDWGFIFNRENLTKSLSTFTSF